MASPRESVDLLRDLCDLNSQISEVMATEWEQPRSNTVQIACYCGRRGTNPLLSLVIDCCFQV
jgi:hypothetical protein